MDNRHHDAIRRISEADDLWIKDGHESVAFLLHCGGTENKVDHPNWNRSWAVPEEATIDDLSKLGLVRTGPADPSQSGVRSFWLTDRGREEAKKISGPSIIQPPTSHEFGSGAGSEVFSREEAVVVPPRTAFVSWAHGNPNWRRAVADFVFKLREFGIEADVDLIHLHESGINWANYGPNAVKHSDFVLIATSAAYKERWEETGDPKVGAGVAREANVLKSLFNADRDEFYRKVKIVVLPGTTERDIPDELRASVGRFEVASLDLEGLGGLLRVLTDQAAYVPPPVGTVPILPQEFLVETGTDKSEDGSTDANAVAADIRERLSEIERKLATESGSGEQDGEQNLGAEQAVLEAALNVLPVPTFGIPLVWMAARFIARYSHKLYMRAGRDLRGVVRPIPSAILAVIVAVVAGLIVYHLTSKPAVPDTGFFGEIDANAVQSGAPTFHVARIGSDPAQPIKIGERRQFVGFCIGQPQESVATGIPDERWFILANHTMVSAALVDGGPPPSLQPVTCSGARPGPRTIALSGHQDGRRLILSTIAMGAAVVGFAVRATGMQAWKPLPLKFDSKTGFRIEATITGPVVAIAAPCWAQGAPAHPDGPGEFVLALTTVGDVSRRLRTQAASTSVEGVRAACSNAYSQSAGTTKRSLPASQGEPSGKVSESSPRTLSTKTESTGPTTSTIYTVTRPSESTPHTATVIVKKHVVIPPPK